MVFLAATLSFTMEVCTEVGPGPMWEAARAVDEVLGAEGRLTTVWLQYVRAGAFLVTRAGPFLVLMQFLLVGREGLEPPTR